MTRKVLHARSGVSCGVLLRGGLLRIAAAHAHSWVGAVHSVAFSPDGRYLAVGGTADLVHIMETEGWTDSQNWSLQF